MHVFGKNVAKEILNNPKIVNKIYLYDNFNDKDILNKIKDNNIQTKLLPKHELDKIENGNHQGIILDIKDYNYCFLDKLLDKKYYSHIRPLRRST